jgi:hypothetical protein
MASYWVDSATGVVYAGDLKPGDASATPAQISAWQASIAAIPPPTVTQGQFMLACAQLGIGGTTAAEVLAFEQNGALPAWIATIIATLPTAQQIVYQVHMLGDANYSMTSPVMPGVTQAQLVAIFTLAETL